MTNGINYFLTYELSVMSSCLPLEENCQNVEQPSHIICSVELHEKPWIETSLVVLHSNCTKDSDNNLENEIVPSLPNEGNMILMFLFEVYNKKFHLNFQKSN